jgi:hypothetical protein
MKVRSARDVDIRRIPESLPNYNLAYIRSISPSTYFYVSNEMKAEIGRRERKNRTAGKCVYEGCCVAAHNRLFSLTLFVIYSRRGSTLLPRELCMDTCRVGCSAERRGGLQDILHTQGSSGILFSFFVLPFWLRISYSPIWRQR